MATAIEAPASTTAEGPTQHTHFKPEELLRLLDPDQVVMLREELEPWRIGDDGKGHSAIEHWDVRRSLIRIFGVGGYDIFQVHPPECIAVLEIKPDSGNGPTKYTVVYKALTRLVIRNRQGVQLAVFEDGAIDEGLKQPSLAQAHDQGYKGSMSGALKRCAMNLGDAFGLSLYNKGSEVPVVYTPADRYRDQAVAAWDDFQVIGQTYASAKADEVLEHKVWNYDGSARVYLWKLLQERGNELQPKAPESGSKQDEGRGGSGAGGNAGERSESTPPVDETPSSEPGTDHLARLRAQANACWMNPGNSLALAQIILDAEKHKVADSEVTLKNGRVMTFRELLNGRITELEQQAGAAV